MELINKEEVLELVKNYFSEVHDSLKLRNESEQNIVGNLITVTELELKKEIKNLKIYENKSKSTTDVF